jgi:hypothetical protein
MTAAPHEREDPVAGDGAAKLDAFQHAAGVTAGAC